MFSIETIVDVAKLEALSEEWAALDAGISPRLPFTSPSWALNWWRTFRRNEMAARDELHCYVLRDGDGGLAGVAPMMVTHRPGYGPLRMSELQFLGADPYVTEWRGLICKPEIRAEAVAALSAHVARERPADVVQWRGLPAEAEAVVPGLMPQDTLDTTVFYLALPDSWEAMRQGLPRNLKESLRKCYNSLAREKHEFSLRVVTTPQDARNALHIFFALHAMRSDAQDRINHPDVFADGARREFTRAFCQSMADRGSLRIFQLIIAEKVVATRIGFILGDEIYMYFSGYDLAWSRFSVMTTLVAEAVKWSIGERLRIFNLSTGNDVSKTRWRPATLEFRGGHAILGGMAARVAFDALQAVRQRRAKPRATAATAATAPAAGA